MKKNTEIAPGEPMDPDIYRDQALVLLRNEKTMVLAVHADDGPWVAPVYFLFDSPGIYFFSSPRSKHIRALRHSGQAAGAIFVDGDQLQNIQGLQMIGRVEQVHGMMQRLNITTRYLAKFPLARKMLMPGTEPAASLDARVGLYVFRPSEIHCTDNRQGFGRRVLIKL